MYFDFMAFYKTLLTRKIIIIMSDYDEMFFKWSKIILKMFANKFELKSFYFYQNWTIYIW